MRAVLFTENTSPCYLTHFLYMGVAAGAAVAGYHIGRNYVIDNYYIGDPQAFLMGGFSGAVACFGLVLQILVDLSRLKPVKWLDDKLKLLEQFLLHFLQHTAPPLNQPLLENNVLARGYWDNSKKHVLKLLGLRLTHYSVACAVGVATIGYPMSVMYNGGDITESKEQNSALFVAFLLAAFEIGLAFSAYRSDQRDGVMLVAHNPGGFFHATVQSDSAAAADVENSLANRSPGSRHSAIY